MSSKERDPTIEIEKAIYDKLMKLSKNSRKKLKPFVNDLLLDFINQGNISSKQEKDYKTSKLEEEMKELKKQTDDSQKMFAIMMQNTYQNRQSMFPNAFKNIPVSQEFKKKDNLIGKSATEEQMVIFDESLEKEITIKIKNNALICTHDKSDSCEHTYYAMSHISFLMKLIQKGIKLPNEDYYMKKLEEISNTKEDN